MEYDGGTYNPNGLNTKELTMHFKKHKTVRGFVGGKTIARNEEIA